ncbi:hypothetical protein Tco_0660719 [Tanacetum coccineum]
MILLPCEYEQYLKADFVTSSSQDFELFDVLGLWKAKENQFPSKNKTNSGVFSDVMCSEGSLRTLWERKTRIFSA